MIARPPTTPPTMAPTGAGLDDEAGGVEELDAAVEAAFEAVAMTVGDVVSPEVEDRLEVELANMLVGVEDGAAIDKGGACVPVERLRKLKPAP